MLAARENVAGVVFSRDTLLGREVKELSICASVRLSITVASRLTKTTRGTCFPAPVSEKQVLNASGRLEARRRRVNNMNGALRYVAIARSNDC